MKRVLWFRRDLRIHDNPLLSLGGDVFPIFIFDTNILEKLRPEDRRVTLLYRAVQALRASLRAIGLELYIFHGDPVNIFRTLQARHGFDEVCASIDYDQYAKTRDRDVSHILTFRVIDDVYLFTPQAILKDDGTPFRRFSAFYNRAKERLGASQLKEYAIAQQRLIHQQTSTLTLAQLGFHSVDVVSVDVDGLLDAFEAHLAQYEQRRDFVSEQGTSHISVALRFGFISIRAVMRWLVQQKKKGINTEPFFRELLFREFYAHMLFHFERLQVRNFAHHFNGIEDVARHNAFISGKTGVPIVDAAVHELLKTGLMHNRMRMICASFYTKDLLLPWQWGEAFFASNLLDYDAASNVLNWQWSAGTGIDAQPYFRVFNPWLQSKKFDKAARYIKTWLRCLQDIDAKHLHDENWLQTHDVNGYVQPIVVHKEAKALAIEYFTKDKEVSSA